jgi:hypothetical protein
MVLGAGVVIWAVMIRASKAQRARTKGQDFGGRYTDFGFLLGTLRATERRRGEGEAAPDGSNARPRRSLESLARHRLVAASAMDEGQQRSASASR